MTQKPWLWAEVGIFHRPKPPFEAPEGGALIRAALLAGARLLDKDKQ